MDIISGSRKTLQLGFRSAWANLVLFIIYDTIVITGIMIGKGVLVEPYLVIAEVMSMVSAPLLILLMASIHECAPANAKIYSLTALGWMFLLAASTMIVHFTNLTLWRQVSAQQRNVYVHFLGWEWPSMMYAIELLAWHLFFGLSVFFAAFAFRGKGWEKAVRLGLIATGLLCISGLTGPLTGEFTWRLIGIFGYGICFPVVCFMLTRVFRNVQSG